MAIQSPFSSWQTGPIDPSGRIPLTVLIQGTLSGTIDDETTEHAEALFDELDDRGLDAWRETAVTLVQYLLSGGHYGEGPEASERYLAVQPAPDERAPALNLVHTAMATFLASGREAAEQLLTDTSDEATIAGATRLLFCIAAATSGYPKHGLDALRKALCGSIFAAPKPEKPKRDDHAHDGFEIPVEHAGEFAARAVDGKLLSAFVGSAFDGCTTCQDVELTRIVADPPTCARLVELACVMQAAEFGGLPPSLTDSKASGIASQEFRQLARAGLDGNNDALFDACKAMKPTARRKAANTAADLIVGTLDMRARSRL